MMIFILDGAKKGMNSMYTIEYQLKKACEIADSSEYARVGFFCNFLQLKEYLYKDTLENGIYNIIRREYISSSGGTVRFVDIDNIENVCAGAQFSHVFTNNLRDAELRAYIDSRLRTVHEFEDDIGHYDEFGLLSYKGY